MDNQIITMLENSIYSSSGLGIDLGSVGVSTNDAGDGDGGANELINFPTLNGFVSDITNTITYDFNLDVPSHGDGYRVEFFRDNISGDTHGEGAEYLGFTDIAHDGGDLNFTGTIVVSSPVFTGDNITFTATEIKPGNTFGFGPTSEFSEVIDAESLILQANLSVSKNLADGSTDYTPGGTASYSITVTNNGPDNILAAEVLDNLPTGVVMTGPWGCLVSSGASSCSAASGGAAGDTSVSMSGDLVNGDSLTVTIPVIFSANSASY